MKIIEPSVELAQNLDAAEIMRHIERAGRVCYKSESRISDTSAEKFIANIIKSGHESVIEHVSITFKIVCDRGVTHEIVRHRLASYCVNGDTVIPSYSKIYRNSGKKRTIETIYNWAQNPQCRAAFNQLVIRSFDEKTHTVVPNKIKNVFYNGIQDIFELATASGRIIKCTGGHRFFTDDGWKKLEELSRGEDIYVNGLRGDFKNFETSRAVDAFRDKIVSIKFVGREKVYDLEMAAPYHNYVANGFVVHNSQMSTRYCDYSGDKFGGELSFIKPCFWQEGDEKFELWRQAMQQAEDFYLELRKNGARPEEARSVLPNSLATEIFMTANLREWRHFLKLRTSPRAHPQMRQVALKICAILQENLPVIFSDIVI